jgi:hypothetical protein
MEQRLLITVSGYLRMLLKRTTVQMNVTLEVTDE